MFFILCFLFVIICIFIFSTSKNINSAFLFSLEWTVLSISVCLLDLPKDEIAFFFVLINVIAFAIPHLMISHTKVNTLGVQAQYQIQRKENWFIKADKYIIVLNAISLVFLAYTLGFSGSSFTNTGALMYQMNSVSSLRYSGEEDYLPVFNRLVNTLTYAACGLEGFFICKSKKRIFYLNLLLLMVQTVITNTKATIVFGLAFWGAGFLTGYRFFGIKFNFKKTIIIMLSASVVLFFTIVVNYLRHLGNLSMEEETGNVLTAYVVGPYSAFSLWFTSAPTQGLGMGMNTFSCVFRWFGLSQHEHGDFVNSTQLITNVYTIFKHLISDYSYIGTILFFTLTGVISANIDRYVCMKKIKSVGMSIVLSSMILTAFFSSIFRYSTNLIACLIIICFFVSNSTKVKKAKN